MADAPSAGGGRGGARRRVDARDAWLAAAILAGCVAVYLVTATFDQVPALLAQNITPQLFPRILVVIIGVLALLLPFEHRLQPERWARIAAARRAPVRRPTWLTLGLIGAVAVAAPFLGTILTIVLVCLALPLLWGERRPWLVLLFAGAFAAAVTLLFGVVLAVYFEPGVLGLGLG